MGKTAATAGSYNASPFLEVILPNPARAAAVAALVLVGTLGGHVAGHAQTVASLPSPQASISKGGSAKPTAAWFEFCQRYPAECVVDPNEPELVTLSPQVWGQLVKINKQVNARIKASTDPDHWGLPDRWDFAEDGRGDCEDYQLVKRKLLVQAGVPRRAMRMTVVIDEVGAGHAVMLVRTDRGDYVLDNKHNAVLPWAQTGYIYIKREGHDSNAWVSLGGVTSSPSTTANR